MPTYITDGSLDSPPKITGEDDAMYLQTRTPSRSGSEPRTVDVWKGHIDAARDMYDEYFSNGQVSDITMSPDKATGTVTITWSTSFTDGAAPEPPDQDTAETTGWTVSLIEVPTPLAAHPYFQAAYVAESGELIEDEIARCEMAIKRGRQYVAAGVYKEWVKRYYGLRMAGVEEWTQYGVEVSHTYITDLDATAGTVFENTGKVVQAAALGMPISLEKAIDKLQRITIADNPNSDPTQQPREAAAFEFLARPPDVGYSESDDGNTWDITESWWGLSQWSTVITIEGTWDPQGEVAT